MLFMQNEGHWPMKPEEDLNLVIKERLKSNAALSRAIDEIDDRVKELVEIRVRKDLEFWHSVFNK